MKRIFREPFANWHPPQVGKHAGAATCQKAPVKTAVPSAFTLLELVLALAILAGAIAALGEVMRLADQTAIMTESETQAQVLAASLMDEFASGSRELATVDQQPLVEDSDPPWVYSVAIDTTDFSELVAVRVRVEQKMDSQLQPPFFELVRWMPNPNSISSESTAESETSTSSSSGSSSSASTSGSTSATTSGAR